MENMRLDQPGKTGSFTSIPTIYILLSFPAQRLTLVLIQVHVTPSIGGMWVLIKAVSNLIFYFPDVCYESVFFSYLWICSDLEHTNSTCCILSWARHTIKDSSKDNSKIFLQLINKFAYLGKIWTGCDGLSLKKKKKERKHLKYITENRLLLLKWPTSGYCTSPKRGCA